MLCQKEEAKATGHTPCQASLLLQLLTMHWWVCLGVGVPGDQMDDSRRARPSMGRDDEEEVEKPLRICLFLLPYAVAGSPLHIVRPRGEPITIYQTKEGAGLQETQEEQIKSLCIFSLSVFFSYLPTPPIPNSYHVPVLFDEDYTDHFCFCFFYERPSYLLIFLVLGISSYFIRL